MRLSRLLLFSCAWLVSCSAAAEGWSSLDPIPVGGEGGWDYLTVDAESHRLYVSHDQQVVVLDLQTRKRVGSVPTNGVHGIALAPELDLGFCSNGGDGSVTVFDLRTLKVETKIVVGRGPDAICYESGTKKVFVFNGGSETASIIDARQEKVLAEIPLAGRPEFAQADGHGFVYDALEDKSEVVKIDAARQTVVARWNLPPDSGPSGMAIDPSTRRIFVGCRSRIMAVMDGDSGKIITTLPIGAGVDACCYDPIGHRVFASCGDGTMTVIRQDSPDSYSISEVVKTAPRARTMAFDAGTATAYLPVAKFGPMPPATPEHPHPRPPIIANSLEILVVSASAGK